MRLERRPTIEYRPGWEVEYDEWDMRLGKAILWAAGKEPKLSLTLTPKAKELARASLPGIAATLAWQGAGAGATADVTLRRDDGATVDTRKQPLDKADGTADLSAPAVRAGNYHLDIVVRDGTGVAGFASVPFAVTSERKVEAVKLVQDWAEIGEHLSGQDVLSGQAGADESLVISLFDRRGRVVARQTAKPGDAETAFEFEVQPWFPMLVEVQAMLTDGAGKWVASAWKYATVSAIPETRKSIPQSPRTGGTPSVLRWSSQTMAGRRGRPFASVQPIVARCVVTARPAIASRLTPGWARSPRTDPQTVRQ